MTHTEIAEQAREALAKILQVIDGNTVRRKEHFERMHNRTNKYLGNYEDEKD